MADASPVVKPQERSIMPVLVVLALLWWFGQGGGIPNILPPSILPTTATAVVYVYEKDQHAIPAPVSAALDKINREKKINATQLDVDTKDGTGEIPDQYKVPFAEAVRVGLPALVVTAGDKVLNSVKSPTTMEQVLEAVR